MSPQPRIQTRHSSSSSPAGFSTKTSTGAQKPPAAEPRPSSSIVLLSPTNQVLLLHRVRTSTSFPSAHVFPGGNISAFHDETAPASSPSSSPLPPPGHPDRHRDSAAYRLAAIRETFEESGILLARKKRQPPADDGDVISSNNNSNDDDQPLITVPEATREDARRRVHSGDLHFQDWVARALGAAPCTGELLPFTRWVTPPNQPRRFTTQMYLFLMPLASATTSPGAADSDSDVDVDVDVVQTPTTDGGVEHTAATFADAAEWLRRQAGGEIVLFPPQCYLLTLVAEALGSVRQGEGEGEGEGSGSGDGRGGDRARYAAQRKALLEFVGRTPTSAGAAGPWGDGKEPHPTALIPWSEKVMSPHTLFIRDSDRRLVLGVDKPGPELKGCGRGGDFERVVLVNFTKQGPRQVEVRKRGDVLREEREAKEKKREAAKL